MSPVDEVATNGEHLPKLMLPILPKTIASVEKPCKSRGHVSDNCQGYMFLLYKCFKEIINSWNYDFLIFLPFTIWYIVSTFFWKTSSDLPQSTRWYNTTVILSQMAMYPPYELFVAGITKWTKIRLQETSILYSNYFMSITYLLGGSLILALSASSGSCQIDVFLKSRILPEL